jgi:DNA transposition AAA+ family ATPase
MEFNLSSEQKEITIAEVKKERLLKYDNDRDHATALGISESYYSRLINAGEIDLLSDSKWRTLSKRYGLMFQPWVTAKTPSFVNLTETFKYAQQYGYHEIVVDDAGNEKTESAKWYARHNKYAVYVDCSKYKNRRDMITQAAKGLGIPNKGGFNKVRLALFEKLGTVRCIVFLDEAGDLDTPGFLEIKALMNAAEGTSAIIPMGADGVRALIEKRLTGRKVGYAEIFDRVGRKFTRAVSDEQLKDILRDKPANNKLTDREYLFTIEAGLIIQANLRGADGKTMQKLITKANYSKRRLRIEVEKLNLQ